jgi:hypothetical protein
MTLFLGVFNKILLTYIVTQRYVHLNQGDLVFIQKCSDITFGQRFRIVYLLTSIPIRVQRENQKSRG